MPESLFITPRGKGFTRRKPDVADRAESRTAAWVPNLFEAGLGLKCPKGALSETVWEAPGPVDRDRIANLSLHRSELDGDMSGPRSGKVGWLGERGRGWFRGWLALIAAAGQVDSRRTVGRILQDARLLLLLA